MKRVGDFYNAGLEFVIGDECDSSDGQMLSNAWVKYSNENDTDFVNCTPTKFAWRTNTGKKPSFSGWVEVELPNGEKCTLDNSGLNSGYWERLTIKKWRPSLNQSTIQTETPEEKEAFEAMTESKPIFTQAMEDAGEFPPVGSSFRVHKTEYFMVGVSSSGSVVGEHPGFAEYKGFHAKDCKPIRSEREKAIYAMKDDIREFKGQYVHLDNYDAGKLYDANYRKLTPSQAKAYDDKTEYFGEDYK